MSDYNLFLAGLSVYPSLHQIDKASRYAEEITAGYVRKIDPYALLTVEDGDVNIYSNSNFEGLHFNAQCIFDTAFADMIKKIQIGSKNEFALLDMAIQEEMIADHGKFILTELSGDFLCDVYSCGDLYVVLYYQYDNYWSIKSKCFSTLDSVFLFLTSLNNK